MFDTHAHLDADEFAADLDGVIRRAEDAHLTGIVCPGVDARSSEKCLEIAARCPLVHAAVGIQPNSAAGAGCGDWDRIVELAARPRVVALGETGLDRYWDYTPFDVQQDYFDRHLRLAQERGLAVIVHCREAEADVLAMLGEAARRGPLRGVIHAFSGDGQFAESCLGLGMYISLAGTGTYRNKKFAALHAAAGRVPADRLLIETDSPYLVPHPLRGKQPRNEPALITHTVDRLAELRGADRTELIAHTAANARSLFGVS